VTAGRKVASALATMALAAATAGLSRVPMSTADGDAFVRLSWRTEPIRVEECRTLTEEELAEIPAHMRRTEECTGYFVDYEVTLEVDGHEPMVDTVAPSGLRRDRPVYVLRDRPVRPGRHSVDVSFTALVPESFEPDDQPIALEWSGPMELVPGEVGLVTLDDTGRSLLRGGDDRP
jgi:hypothetical protein